MKENTDHLIKSFNASLGALLQRVDANSANIGTNTAAIAKQAAIADKQQTELRCIADRVASLEKTSNNITTHRERPATLGPEYTRARRSVRLWPVQGGCEDEMWGNVGVFLHKTLAISGEHLGQEDIERIDRAMDGRDHAEMREVIVRFFDKQKRDLVVANSPALSTCFDKEGRPTAGIRLEVPPELDDTFRLLSRFGTRLRARHGTGTKRHIKFDDYNGSLYSNVKLPGVEVWTKVTPEMAREDLAASMHEEGVLTRKRLAAKLVPGPKERLGRPLPDVRPGRGPPSRVSSTLPAITSQEPVAGPSGKRPRWSVPERRRPL